MPNTIWISTFVILAILLGCFMSRGMGPADTFVTSIIACVLAAVFMVGAGWFLGITMGVR